MSPENTNPTQPTQPVQPAAPATLATPQPVAPTPAPASQPATPVTPAQPAAPTTVSAPTPTPAVQPATPVTPAQPAAPTPVPTPTPAASPTVAAPYSATPAPTPQTPAPSAGCKCPTINPSDWDKKKTQINKTFFKTYSPRLLYYPFSFEIDLYRAVKGATAKGYKPVEKGMVLDTGGMFWANVMVEVTGANAQDPDVVSLEGKEVYTKVSRSEWKDIKNDIAELEKELGRKPAQLYIWWTSCPKCVAGKEAKAVLIAL